MHNLAIDTCSWHCVVCVRVLYLYACIIRHQSVHACHLVTYFIDLPQIHMVMAFIQSYRTLVCRDIGYDFDYSILNWILVVQDIYVRRCYTFVNHSINSVSLSLWPYNSCLHIFVRDGHCTNTNWKSWAIDT